MGNNTNNSQKQQFSTKPTPETKSANTQKNRLYTNCRKRQKKNWTTFTYHSPKIRKITNLFKNTNIDIVFRTTATLHQLIKPIISIQTPEHEKSGIYKLTCSTCQRSYIGQARHHLKSRFQEHKRCIKNNEPHSAYALHILNCRHECGSITEIHQYTIAHTSL